MKKIIIANWKMHPDTATIASALAKAIEKEVTAISGIEVAVAPPLLFLAAVGGVLSRAILGAQDVSWADDAASVGEVSAHQLAGMGVRYVLIGHSERRMRLGETDEDVNKKLRVALGVGMSAIVCVGEDRRGGGDIPKIVSDQVAGALAGIRKTLLAKIIIAYEPAWAISTSVSAAGTDSPDRIFRARLAIEKAIADLFGSTAAKKVRIIYGGSVDADNAAAIMREGRMDGLLVGSASLRAEEFGMIARSAAEVARC